MISLFKLFVYFVLLSIVYGSPAAPARAIKEGAVGFPENEENPDLRNREDRKPVYIPAMCPDNELYYPGDQKDDWICDCRPAYLYHPSSDTCWGAWTRGPCAERQYLVLPPNSVIPACENNPCLDGEVVWNSRCEALGSVQPCGLTFPPKVLGVNATTLLVDCVIVTIGSRSGESNTQLDTTCSPGCRRSVKGKCT